MAPPQSGASFRSFLGIPPSSPSPKDTVLIIIDAQNEYVDGKLAIVDVAASRAVIASTLKKWRDQTGDVVHVVHSTPEGAPLFTPGTELAEEFEELRIAKGEFCFHGYGIGCTFEEIGKNKILLVGYMAHVCISGTSRAGAELGYDVSIVRDGIGDRDIPGASAKQLVEVVVSELGDVSATIVDSKDL